MTGGAPCSVCAVNGHAAAAPPSSVRNWRGPRSNMGSPPEPGVPAYRSLSMPRKRPRVLGVDLNRSESRRWRDAAGHTAVCPTGVTEYLAEGRADHSGLMLANFTTLAHFSMSSAMNLPNSAEDLANAGEPKFAI